MKVLLFIPTLGTINTYSFNCFMSIKTKHNYKLMTTSRMLINQARNMAIKECVKGQYDYLVMCDEDNPPIYNNFIDMLVDEKKDIISGVVRLRTRKEDLNIYYSEKVDGLKKYISYKKIDKEKKIIKIDNCGSGLVCLSGELCDKISKRYYCPFENKFTWYIEKENGGTVEFDTNNLLNGKHKFKIKEGGGFVLRGRELSEDLLFFERCQELGYQIYCNTHLECVHLGEEKIYV